MLSVYLMERWVRKVERRAAADISAAQAVSLATSKARADAAEARAMAAVARERIAVARNIALETQVTAASARELSAIAQTDALRVRLAIAEEKVATLESGIGRLKGRRRRRT